MWIYYVRVLDPDFVESKREMSPNPPHHDINPRTSEILKVLIQMQKDGYSEATIEPIGKRLRNLAKYVDMDNPEKVKEFIARKQWSEGYKENLVNAYNHYAQIHGIKWELPHYLTQCKVSSVSSETER